MAGIYILLLALCCLYNQRDIHKSKGRVADLEDELGGIENGVAVEPQ
jgi:hypothetical protein